MTTELQQLANELDIACRQGHHQHVIQQSTLALDMVDLQLALLDIRARSWSACGKFEKALEDARSMQQLAPSSARGYYRQGRICAQQGHHSKAIEIYKSTETLTIADDALRDDINIAMKESTHKMETKIDMISMLPMDIVSLIASMLFRLVNFCSDQDYHACLDVSKSWRQRLLYSGTLSYRIDRLPREYRRSGPTLRLSKGHSHIIHQAQYIGTLEIHTDEEPFYAFVDRGHFNSLTTLSIEIQPSVSNLEKQYASLHLLNNTLRHLEIECLSFWGEDADKIMSVPEILQVCTNLTTLKSSNIVLGRGPLSIYPTLRRLQFRSWGAVDYDDAKRVLQSLPSLQYLAISQVKDRKLFSFIHEYCPGLRYLECNGVLGKIYARINPEIPSDETGLRSLQIDAKSSYITVNDIAEITMESCSTLEHLTLELPLDIKFIQPVSWRVDDGGFGRLTHVTFYISGYDAVDPQESDPLAIREACQLFGNILCHAPKIKKLRVTGAAIDDLVLRPSLKQLYHLQELIIRNTDQDPEPDSVYAHRENILQQALQEHALHCSTQSRLKKVMLRAPHADAAFIKSISHLKNIDDLFIWIDSSFGDDCTVSLEKLTEKLVYLYLRAPTISDSVVYQLARFKYLKNLFLSSGSAPSDIALCSLSACRQLKTLTIPRKSDDQVIKNIQLAVPGIRLNKS